MTMRRRKQRAYAKRGSRIGKRHREYMSGCIVCECWAFYDRERRWPTFQQAFDIANENEVRW